MKKLLFIFIGFSMALVGHSASIPAKHIYPALGGVHEAKVDVSWNRLHDTEGLHRLLQNIHKAYPDLTKLYSIGESYQGRPIWCLELTNFKKGKPETKPGMYVDGNIHGNEVQAGELVAYTAWYLCEQYERLDRITNLVDRYVFYLIPTINPDGRDHWLKSANTPHSSRTGKKPVDNDKDGLVDEDGYDDLDGDGKISYMRIKDSNGRWKPHPDYPEYLMVRVPADERGEYSFLGYEGIDNDGDGEINEDGPGGYDPNRNWGYDWQPGYVQYGAMEYPFSLPNTRAVADFVIKNPNIAAAHTYHNFGGMFLRGPGREGGAFDSADDNLMKQIMAKGEEIVPYYRSLVTHSDLYSVWGGETDWFYAGQGIMAFTGELWTLKNMFRNDDVDEESQIRFVEYLLFNDGVSPWKPYDHPTYGKIEVGGMRHMFTRVPPAFLLEEECHRNMAFILYHAKQMPKISFGDITVKALKDGLYNIWVEIKNDAMIPTRLRMDVNNNINRPDLLTVEGKNVRVLSAGVVRDKYFKDVDLITARPHRVEIDTVPGLDSVIVQFILSGEGKADILYDSEKGGKLTQTIQLP